MTRRDIFYFDSFIVAPKSVSISQFWSKVTQCSWWVLIGPTRWFRKQFKLLLANFRFCNDWRLRWCKCMIIFVLQKIMLKIGGVSFSWQNYLTVLCDWFICCCKWFFILKSVTINVNPSLRSYVRHITRRRHLYVRPRANRPALINLVFQLMLSLQKDATKTQRSEG